MHHTLGRPPYVPEGVARLEMGNNITICGIILKVHTVQPITDGSVNGNVERQNITHDLRLMLSVLQNWRGEYISCLLSQSLKG